MTDSNKLPKVKHLTRRCPSSAAFGLETVMVAEVEEAIGDPVGADHDWRPVALEILVCYRACHILPKAWRYA